MSSDSVPQPGIGANAQIAVRVKHLSPYWIFDMRLLAKRAAAALFVTLTAGIAHAQPALPPEIALGKSWLIQQVETDGRLRESAQKLATEPQSEAEVIETLVYLSSPVAALTARHKNRALDAGVEHLARRMIALARSGQSTQLLLNELRALQNADGGFGGANAHASTVLDTSLALIALRAAGVAEGSDVGRALDYLAARVNTPAHADWVMATSAKPYVSAYVLYALQTHSARFPISATISAQREALIAQQGNGIYVEVLLDTVAALALQFSSTGETGLTALKDSIRAAQLADGSWQGDAFLTALALRALSVGVVTPPTTDGRVLLRVRDGVTLNYLAGVTLSAVEFPAFSALSGADGKIDSGALPASSYTLSIVKEGYQSRSLGTVSLSAGQTRDLGVFDLSRSANTAVLFGRVTDVSTTNPLAGVEITVTGAATQAATTGPDGTFELSFSVAGPIQVQASRSGYQTVTGSGTLVLGQALRFSPALYPDGNQVPTDATLTAMIVNAQSEAPIPGAVLAVGSASAIADHAGRVRLDHLPTGAFAGQVSHPGYLGANLSGTLAAGSNDAGVVRLMPESNLTESTLSGRVTDVESGVALAGANVSIMGTDLRATTDAEGRYHIAGIGSVPFVAIATAAGYATRQVNADSTLHAHFSGDFALSKLTNLSVSLEGLTMSAPEFEPYTEVGVLGTVRNLSTQQEIGLIFSAVVTGPDGQIVREVPFIRVTADRTFDDTIVRFLAGEAKPITIIWGSFNDTPGSYSVLFRGVTPDGRVAVEGLASYRVNAVTAIGGGIGLDPPILQAGTGQSVAIEADITNLGNQPVPAGDVRMQIKLVAKDDRAPLPPKPTFGGNLAAGSPLNRPNSLTRDAAGNVYALNISGGYRIVRVDPLGVPSIVRDLPNSPVPRLIEWRAPNLLRVAYENGSIADIDLDNANSLTPLQSGPTGLTALTAYTLDAQTGTEYFGGTHMSRPRVLTRSASGAIEVIVDAGLNDTRAAVAGADGKLYALNYNPGAVFRIDPEARAIEPFWIGLALPVAMAVDSAGTFYVSETSPRRISRRYADGTTNVFTSSLASNIVDLRFGVDGALYGLDSDGSIRKFGSDGSNVVWARGILNTVTGVAVQSDGGFFAWGGSNLRYRNPEGQVSALGGTVSIADLTAGLNPGEAFAVSSTGLYRFFGNVSQLLDNQPGIGLVAVAQQNGIPHAAAVDRATGSLLRYDGSQLQPLVHSPFSTNVHRLMPVANDDLVVVNSDSLTRLLPDGSYQRIAKFSNIQAMARGRDGEHVYINSSSDGLLRISLSTGEKLRLRASVPAMQYVFADDGNGGLIFSDYGNRKLVRYDLATNTLADYHVMATNIYPQDLAISPQGDLLVRFWDNTLRRLDGASWTTLDTGVVELLLAPDFRIGYRKGNNLYRAGVEIGSTPQLLSVFVTTPDDSAWLTDDRFAAMYITATNLQWFSAAGTKQREMFGFATPRTMAITSNGEIFVQDTSGYLTKFSNGALARIGRYTAAYRIRADGNDIYMSVGDGLHRLNANGTTARVLSIPGWSTTQYNAFDVSGENRVLSNSTTQEIVTLRNADVVARFQPFANPVAFEQRSDGAWWVSAGNRVVLVDNDGVQSRVYSTQGQVSDLVLARDGRLLATTSGITAISIADTGAAVAISGILNGGTTQLTRLAQGPDGKLLAISSSGTAYVDVGGELQHLVSGVSAVTGLYLRSQGGVVISNSASSALLEYRDGANTVLGNIYDGARHVCNLNNGTLAIVGNSYLTIMELTGRRASFSSLPSSTDARALVCAGNGRILIANYTQSAVRIANSGVADVGLEVGTIVREQVLPLGDLDLDARQHMQFDPWLPPEGGDYEVSIVPITTGVGGRLLNGIHVGPAAHASMTVAPSAVVPGEAAIQIDTFLEGADFTRLARISRSQLQLVGDTVYADAMSLDPSGYLWYRARGGNVLYRMPVTGGVAARVGTFTLTDFKGELPIDSLGRAYFISLVNNKYTLRRTDETGAFVALTDFGNQRVVSLAIDDLDRIYAITIDNKIHQINSDGAKSDYVQLPNNQAPYGLTRAGAGGFYVQQQGERILYVSPEKEVQLLTLDGVDFEYEGVNIAGDCSESMFMTVMRLNGTSATGGEEHTLVQLNGRTGEFGTIINGNAVSEDMTDMDFVTYDRFGSRLLIMSENYGNGRKLLFTVPVTCGAIDMDLHMVLPAGQASLGADPPATRTIVHDNGDIELIWSLREVNKQGQNIRVDSRMSNLVRLEDRPAVKEAFVMLKNSFQPAPVRVDIEVPTVHVRDMVDIAVELDREEYPQQTPVGIRVPMNNLDNVAKTGYLVVRVEDAAGVLVEVLVERLQTFDALELIELNPPYSTGVLRVGDYRVVAEIKDELGGVVAAGFDTFRVIAGNGSAPTLSSAVATDKPIYTVGENAMILASVRNLSANLGFENLIVSERVSDANGQVIYDGSLPQANLEPGAEARLSYRVSLDGAVPGFYDVLQQVRSQTGELLDQQSTRFEVQSIGGITALTGTLAVDPLRIRRGAEEAILGTLRNRGQSDMAGIESILRVIHPGTGASLASWNGVHDLAAGASVDLPQNFATAGLALRDYLVVLSARVGGVERVLAQKPFHVQDVVFEGDIAASPSILRQGVDVNLTGAVRNVGNFPADASVVHLRVFGEISQALIREWQYPTNIAAGSAFNVGQLLNTLPLAIGDYRVRLSVSFEGNELALDDDLFTVGNYRIAGTFEANPGEVERGDPVDLVGMVSNSGNFDIDQLPLRIEVLKVDTQVSMFMLDDSTALAAGASYTMPRVADSATLAPGEYIGVFSAYFDGAWQVMATDNFRVINPIDVSLEMNVPRDARVLVLLSCSQHQAQQTGVSGGHAQTVCEQQRQTFLAQYLSERGIEHRIVLDQASFMTELRCGRYNVFWFAGGAVKLGVAEAIEVRESIYRGDGFIVEGDNDQRNSQFDEMLGLNFRGHHPGNDLPVTGSASLFPEVTRPSYGRMLKLELTTGRVEARFATVNWPAIVSSSYGSGRALSYGFDLIEVLRRDGTDPASERLMMNGLMHVAPITTPADYATGAYVPVTTTVFNRGAGFDARLETEVDAPTVIASSAPTATSGDAARSAWNFALTPGDERSFDVNLMVGNVSPVDVRSRLFERDGDRLAPVGNAQIALAVRDAAAATSALLDGLRSASLHGGENAARNRAISAIESARTLSAQGNIGAAIGKWLDAAAEVRRIDTVSHAAWRLAIARLLAVTQHLGCDTAIKLCGTSPAAPVAFDSTAFQPLSILGKAQGGGAGDWEWQLAGRGDAEPLLRLNLDWQKNRAVDFRLSINAQGQATLQLRQDNVLKGSLSSDLTRDGRLMLADALSFTARNSSDVGNAKVTLNNLVLNGQALSQTLSSSTSGAFAETRLSLFKPNAGATMELTGRIEMGFSGNSLPGGSRLELQVDSGRLQCNGGAQ
jgi:sugar lactone lactonase YvrE